MKLMYREEFLKLEKPVLFRKFTPMIFGDLTIFLEASGPDFLVMHLDWVEADGSDEEHEIYSKAIADSRFEFPADFDFSIRDGMFDRDQMFAVYNKDEVKKLISALEKLL